MAKIALVIVIALAAACAQRTEPTGPGRLSVALTASRSQSGNASLSTAPDVDAVLVKVVKVRAHGAAVGWVEVSDVPVEVDLLNLPAESVALGLSNLPAGKVTQLRLLVDEVGNRVATGGVEVPLVVPSGMESGIKIHGPWNVSSCEETVVALEFDGAKSVWYHPTGQGSPWILRPVIHAKKAEVIPGTCEGEGGEPACVPAECSSGLCDVDDNCAPGGVGTPCGDGEECLSGTCTDEACAAGGPGEPCRIPDDCESGSCGEEGTCGAGEAGGAGAPCAGDGDCLSNACVLGTCGPGGQSAECETEFDCQEGFLCDVGVCTDG
jgi:hypothetical protein